MFGTLLFSGQTEAVKSDFSYTPILEFHLRSLKALVSGTAQVLPGIYSIKESLSAEQQTNTFGTLISFVREVKNRSVCFVPTVFFLTS